jgi:hypothetical protein
MRRLLIALAALACLLGVPAVASAHRPSRAVVDRLARSAGEAAARTNPRVFAIRNGEQMITGRRKRGHHTRCATASIPVSWDYGYAGFALYETCVQHSAAGRITTRFVGGT